MSSTTESMNTEQTSRVLILGPGQAANPTTASPGIDAPIGRHDASGVGVEDPAWLWWRCAIAIAQGRTRSVLRLAAAAEKRRRPRTDSHTDEELMVPIRSLLEHARRAAGSAAERLTTEGTSLTPDELRAEAATGTDGSAEAPLSPREREVAILVADGLSNPEIARELFISKRTVESHVDHIKQKLGVARRHNIMAWALRRSTEEEGST